jgi:DtxR family Mn-dependent transcriptional regulator
MSVSTENFVKLIYTQSQLPQADTKPGTIARLLNVTNAAATDMARKLASKKLINYTKYKQLSLTSKGKELALNVLRKHRLWETFLHQTLNLSLHEIHREAEMLEHQTSDFLIERINEYLGNPQIDPHGDPVPDSKGKLQYNKQNVLLSDAAPGNDYIICRLGSSEQSFFEFCETNNLKVGATIKVIKQFDTNRMTEIRSGDSKLLLNKDFTDTIYLEK